MLHQPGALSEKIIVLEKETRRLVVRMVRENRTPECKLASYCITALGSLPRHSSAAVSRVANRRSTEADRRYRKTSTREHTPVSHIANSNPAFCRQHLAILFAFHSNVNQRQTQQCSPAAILKRPGVKALCRS